MPRLRVDRDTTDSEIQVAFGNLHDRWHDLEDELANPRLFDKRKREEIEMAREGLHVEINRLVTIMQARRRRAASAAVAS